MELTTFNKSLDKSFSFRNIDTDNNVKYSSFIDLFAGIGGFHIALHSLGLECVFASEYDVHARKTYEANFKKLNPSLFKNSNFAGDITKVVPKNIPDFDILCAGFPCQPFSQAGFKRGFDEERGTLFFYIAKIIKEKRPKAFFLENVRHLLNHDEGKTLRTIKQIMKNELGYSFHYKIVKASDFGLPQHRPRLFMVGFRDIKNFEFPKPTKLKLTMSDIFAAKCEKEIGYTLRVGGRGSKITDRRNWDSYLVDGKVKQLSPTEALKMQGFPEDYVFPVSNTQAMKQLGNSIAIPAVKAVAASILKH
ncbi:MAG: DNA cytosine methyltransferase [Rickettsiaceae bacterium]|nr:DNA cytosine methyltransferase [Rickettsiaceae bacterium]